MVLFFPVLLHAQSWTPKDVAPFTYSFSIEENQLKGTGAQILREAILESHFFLLGERHYSARTSELTQALIPELEKAGYQDFIAEIGPESAQVLTELSHPLEEAREQITNFYQKYAFEAYEDAPIPFFEGKEDLDFLIEAFEREMKLHGIDQEYYNSTFHLFDRMFEQAPSSKALDNLKDTVMRVIHQHYGLDMEQNNYRLFKNMSEKPIIKEALEKLAAAAPANTPIAEALLKTWDIYGRYMKRDGTSHVARIQYMRQNFSKVVETKPDGKFFVKMGALHIAKRPRLSAYDVGDLANSLAEKKGVKATHIACTSRYYEQGNKVSDYWESMKQAGFPFSFIQLGKKDAFTLIDLRALRTALESGTLELAEDLSYHQLRQTLEGYDLLIIMPEDQEQERHY